MHDDVLFDECRESEEFGVDEVTDEILFVAERQFKLQSRRKTVVAVQEPVRRGTDGVSSQDVKPSGNCMGRRGLFPRSDGRGAKHERRRPEKKEEVVESVEFGEFFRTFLRWRFGS